MKPEKPFGWVHMTDGKWEDFFLYKDGVGECEDCEYCIPLYTAPVRSSDKRKWVGLTDEEAWKCWDWEDFQGTWKSMEAKLKKKNT